jgi:hypothetical protein
MKKPRSILTDLTKEKRMISEIDETLEWMIALGMMDVEMRNGVEYVGIRPQYRKLSKRKFWKTFDSKMKMLRAVQTCCSEAQGPITAEEVSRLTGAPLKFFDDLICSGLMEFGKMSGGVFEAYKPLPEVNLVDTVLGTKRFVPVVVATPRRGA